MLKTVFSFRLDPESIVQLQRVSAKKYLQPRTMVRMWIMERLEKELKIEKEMMKRSRL